MYYLCVFAIYLCGHCGAGLPLKHYVIEELHVNTNFDVCISHSTQITKNVTLSLTYWLISRQSLEFFQIATFVLCGLFVQKKSFFNILSAFLSSLCFLKFPRLLGISFKSSELLNDLLSFIAVLSPILSNCYVWYTKS